MARRRGSSAGTEGLILQSAVGCAHESREIAVFSADASVVHHILKLLRERTSLLLAGRRRRSHTHADGVIVLRIKSSGSLRAWTADCDTAN